MNEKLARKLGEVLAFARAGIDTFQKGEKALKAELGEDYVNFINDNESFIKRIGEITGEAGTTDVVNKKADKTFEKLNKMRDMYIGDDWDDAVEIFEWSGFFNGAGMVHWGLVESAARKQKIDELTALAEEGTAFYHRQLMSILSELKMVGKSM